MMKTIMLMLIMAGLAVSCSSSRRQTGVESIGYVAKSVFEADRFAGMVKIYYPSYSPMNIKAANSNLVGTGIVVVGYGDLIQSHLLDQFQREYNVNVEAWLKATRQTDIETLLKEFNNK